jgi:hypothetical protein
MENKALVLDLIEWVAARPRTYAEVMDAWRTSCPRLQIWEDATDLGLAAAVRGPGAHTVTLTPAGRALLDTERPGWSEKLHPAGFATGRALSPAGE